MVGAPSVLFFTPSPPLIKPLRSARLRFPAILSFWLFSLPRSLKYHRVSTCNSFLALSIFSIPPPSPLLPFSFRFDVASAMTTPKIHPESPEEFEFIETPEASATTPAEPCGVRTTSVSSLVRLLWWCAVSRTWADQLRLARAGRVQLPAPGHQLYAIVNSWQHLS